MRKSALFPTVAALTATVAVAQFKAGTPPKSGGHVQGPQAENAAPLQITTPSQVETQLSQAPRISRNEAQKLVKAGKAVYIDVRSLETYNKGHLPGALSIPGSQLLHRLQELPTGKKLITDRKSTRLNSSHANISYAVFCLKKKKKTYIVYQRSSKQRPKLSDFGGNICQAMTI